MLPSGASPSEQATSALDRSVRREDRACARHLAVDEPQRPERAILAKEALAAAEDERVDHQPELVDEVVLDQRLVAGLALPQLLAEIEATAVLGTSAS
jgi:hypothetical protein